MGAGGMHFNIWDLIAEFRGVDALLMDLAERPGFMHETARRFMGIARSRFKQIEEQDLLDARPLLVHCTPVCAPDLPAADWKGHYRPKDAWGRCAAQILVRYPRICTTNSIWRITRCGSRTAGCSTTAAASPSLDRKIDYLRKRFDNLRKISITPWADARRASEQIGRDFVMAAKPNPAFVATSPFRPEPVRQEIARYCEVCREQGTPLEFVLKDISTIANDPHTLSAWADTVKGVIDANYG